MAKDVTEHMQLLKYLFVDNTQHSSFYGQQGILSWHNAGGQNSILQGPVSRKGRM